MNFISINMVNNLSFDITTEARSVLIVGGNGFGKTTFFRACSGLWSLRSGRIQSVEGVMFFQETPALTDGTLMEQLSNRFRLCLWFKLKSVVITSKKSNPD